MKAGHYFCSFCNDVVFQEFTERYEVCSRCGNRSAVWTVPAPATPALATPATADKKVEVQP